MNLIVSEILNETNVAIVALVISLIFSIASLIIETYRYNKSNKITAEIDFFKSIFHEHLLKNIPEARSRIQRLTGGKIEGIDGLANILNSLRQDALFFKYKDKKFYNKLKDSLQTLEDKITVIDKLDEERYDEFKLKLNKDIENIYALILNKEAGIEDKESKVIKFFKNNIVWIIPVFIIIVLIAFIFYILKH
ncbi:TPA: hypothetical protein ACF3TQ_000623 [Enterococcus faecium]|nr:hypothetical protein [Enterococcus faecium]PQC90985.1 hypothetical protein CUN41_04585 [Enterococcus faecium]PQD56025.1 hypothetical protein CUM58_05255 [Enterococcus faecium]